jgi:hypothetical protein
MAPQKQDDESRALVREAQRLHGEEMAELEHTEGWAQLSDRQRAFIVYSLFFRAPGEEASIPHEEGDWYCHAAVWAVEHEHAPEALRPELDHIEDSFYDGVYGQPKTLAEIREQIRATGFPAIVHITKEPPPLTLLQQHTFLALGLGADGDIVVWEKEAEELPYRRTTLSANYAKYADDQNPLFWGVRKLRVPT